jgi:hypothetical protein
MNNKKIKIIILILVLFFAAIVLVVLRGDEDDWICADGAWQKHGHPSAAMPTSGCGEKPTAAITNFDECVAAGNPVMESYPRQCNDKQGNHFTEKIAAEKKDIILDYPIAEQTVTSPLKLSGRARGSWFFEASFPVILTNWDGLIIASGTATTKSDWMTEKLVPFEATLEFKNDSPVSNRASLILKKDNPSGLPENDDALEITVFLK